MKGIFHLLMRVFYKQNEAIIKDISQFNWGNPNNRINVSLYYSPIFQRYGRAGRGFNRLYFMRSK